MKAPGMTLQVEGWRGIAHSYALVNQFQLVEFARTHGLGLFHRDMPFFGRHWVSREGLFLLRREEVIRPGAAASARPGTGFRLQDSLSLQFCPDSEREAACVRHRREQRLPQKLGRWSRQRKHRAGGGIQGHPPDALRVSRNGFIRSGANPDRVKVVPHGVDSGLFKPASPEAKALGRQKLGLKTDDFVFLNVGSLAPNKGIPLLLKAFVQVAAKHPQARLVLKFNQSLYSSRAFMEELGTLVDRAERAVLASHVQLLGGLHPMADLALLYQACDAYVAPDHAEGFNIPAWRPARAGFP